MATGIRLDRIDKHANTKDSLVRNCDYCLRTDVTAQS